MLQDFSRQVKIFLDLQVFLNVVLDKYFGHTCANFPSSRNLPALSRQDEHFSCHLGETLCLRCNTKYLTRYNYHYIIVVLLLLKKGYL
jgi:hypothetical protein